MVIFLPQVSLNLCFHSDHSAGGFELRDFSDVIIITILNLHTTLCIGLTTFAQWAMGRWPVAKETTHVHGPTASEPRQKPYTTAATPAYKYTRLGDPTHSITPASAAAAALSGRLVFSPRRPLPE